MKFDKKTPRQDATIQEIAGFQIPMPFSEGHQCTANEADALNQLLKENIRNNFAPRVKAAKESDAGADLGVLQAELDERLKEYEFGVRKGGGSRDPVMQEAMTIARQLVRDALKEQGVKLSDIGGAKVTELAEGAIQQNAWITEEARKRVDARRQAAGALKLDL